ncbi:HTH merR-type domain-containing protein [Azospirillaceae bacterium]
MVGAIGRAGVKTQNPMKSAAAFRTISEVSTELEIPQHVLRFWETKFPEIRPLKRGGGRRYYRPEDVDLLRRIQHLLYSEGYTIKGVQRLLSDEQGGGDEENSLSESESDQEASDNSLRDVEVNIGDDEGEGGGAKQCFQREPSYPR